jgi:hypothetical protein
VTIRVGLPNRLGKEHGPRWCAWQWPHAVAPRIWSTARSQETIPGLQYRRTLAALGWRSIRRPSRQVDAAAVSQSSPASPPKACNRPAVACGRPDRSESCQFRTLVTVVNEPSRQRRESNGVRRMKNGSVESYSLLQRWRACALMMRHSTMTTLARTERYAPEKPILCRR